MTIELLNILRCPVSREPLTLEIISKGRKMYDGKESEIIETGLLRSTDCIYPIIAGVPRLLVEACIDYESFLSKHVENFQAIKKSFEEKYAGLLSFVLKKNKRTKESFSQEWNLFDYEHDKVWDADEAGMLDRFLRENDINSSQLKGKIILDAGCGNGLLNQSIAASGALVVGMDFSESVERAFQQNSHAGAVFIQGDVQFPPVAFNYFDIVHSSGVLIHTTNSELTFSCLEPCVKSGGTMSVWLYHPRKDFIHNLFNRIRKYTSKLPIRVQYYLYSLTLLPMSFVVKRLKGNQQNKREMLIDILDWFSPEFRWEHAHDEVEAWFAKRQFHSMKVTTNELFGFNIVGTKN